MQFWPVLATRHAYIYFFNVIKSSIHYRLCKMSILFQIHLIGHCFTSMSHENRVETVCHMMRAGTVCRHMTRSGTVCHITMAGTVCHMTKAGTVCHMTKDCTMSHDNGWHYVT